MIIEQLEETNLVKLELQYGHPVYQKTSWWVLKRSLSQLINNLRALLCSLTTTAVLLRPAANTEPEEDRAARGKKAPKSNCFLLYLGLWDNSRLGVATRNLGRKFPEVI